MVIEDLIYLNTFSRPFHTTRKTAKKVVIVHTHFNILSLNYHDFSTVLDMGNNFHEEFS